MGAESTCYIEQDKGDRVFLRSANGRNHFWVNVLHDPDWDVEL